MIQQELARYFSAPVCSHILRGDKPLTEIRLRVNRPVQLVYFAGGDCFLGEEMDARQIWTMALSMMEHSYCAREEELSKGYFTMTNGCRVGVGGSFSTPDGKKYQLKNITSLCIRIARDIIGCAEVVMKKVASAQPSNTLILSAPGKGKTTLLRDMARIYSDMGYRVGIADERHEIAACANGSPSFDIGARSDVVDGCPKAMAIEMLIRSLSPQIIITDEIGNPGDCRAIWEAARKGVYIAASAHASSFEEFECSRTGVLVRDGLFRYVILIGEKPGQIQEIRQYGREGLR